MSERLFRYLRDPLCVSAWCLYFLNRFLIKPRLPVGETFFRGHFNDLLLVPCVIPALLLLHRKLSLRQTDAPPRAREIALHLVVWSILFELIAPLLIKDSTQDVWDVLAYWLGGFICWIIWNRPRRNSPSSLRPEISPATSSLKSRLDAPVNNSARLFLSLALLSLCATLAPAQKRACPVPPPSPYKHNGVIVTTYDRATGGMRTTMTHPQVIGTPEDGLYLTASFLYANAKRPGARPVVEVAFVSVSRSVKYRDSHNLVFLADGREIPSMTAAQYQTAKQGQGLISEATKVAVPYEALVNLLAARRVSARLGSTQINLTNNQIEALRELASLMSPPNSWARAGE